MPTDFGTVHFSEMDIPMRVVLGFVCFFIAVFLRRLSISGLESWRGTRKPVGPSLKESPSPWSAMTTGTEGCLKFYVAGILMIVAGIFAINLFAPKTDLVVQSYSLVKSAVGVLFDLLKKVANALT